MWESETFPITSLTMKYQSILVGIDFSKASVRALKEAIRLGSYDATPIHLLHVVDQRIIENLEDQVVVDEDRTLSDSKRRLEDFAAEHAGDYPHLTTETVLDHPFRSFIKVSKERKADFLVLGSRGTSDDPHRLGVVASKCLRKAATPLLIVDPAQGESIKKVVCAVDYSETSKRAIEHAIHIANLEQADLEFLHVYIPPSSFQNPESGVMLMGFEGIADYPNITKNNLEQFVEPFRNTIKDSSVNCAVVDHMSVGRGIINHLKDRGGDLLVLGTHGRTGWRTLLLGTTAEHVFHKIPCSTLAVKPSDFTFEAD